MAMGSSTKPPVLTMTASPLKAAGRNQPPLAFVPFVIESESGLPVRTSVKQPGVMNSAQGSAAGTSWRARMLVSRRAIPC